MDRSPRPDAAPQILHDTVSVDRRWFVGTLVYTSSGLAVLFFWLLWGDFAWNMKERAVTPVAQLMLKSFNASDFLVGLLVGSLPSAIGLLLGPIISMRSDRHRGRWGRRIPFMLIPTPFAALAMVGIAFTPQVGAIIDQSLGARSPGIDACRLIAFAMSWSAFEILTIIVNAVFGGLINDVVPEAVIGRFFGLFRAVSLLAAVVFNFWLIGFAETHYREIFIGLALLYGVGFSLMCLFVKEGQYPEPPPMAARDRFGPLGSIKTYIKECYTDPYYLWVFLALMLGALAPGPVNTFSIFYAKSLNISVEWYGKLLVITYIISFTASFFLGWLADKFHPLRVGIVSLSVYGIMMCWGGFVADTSFAFAFAFITHGVLAGAYITSTASMAQRLFPRQRFAQFASAAGIVGALGYTILPPTLGKFLDATGHVYRYTFLGSALIAAAGVFAHVVVYRKFLRLGGDREYVAP